MPARTEPFQRLILRIHEQLASAHGATVTVEESPLTAEPSSGSTRETDIRVVVALPALTVRCAIECRAHSRRQGLPWIDELIGKYRDLNYDKVIAVSKSGFAPAALKKAASAKIECRTLEEALETDWPDEFVKLGLAHVTFTFVKPTVALTFSPPISEGLRDGEEFQTRSGRRYRPADYVESATTAAAASAMKTIVGPQGVFKTLADLDRGCKFEIAGEAHEETWVERDGVEHRVVKAVYRAIIVATKSVAQVQHQRYSDALVSTVDPSEPEDPGLVIVQGKEGVARVLRGPELDIVGEVRLESLRKQGGKTTGGGT